jgi:hypothetical protein
MWRNPPSQIRTLIPTSTADALWRPETRLAIVEHLAHSLWSYLNGAAAPADKQSILRGLTRLPASDFDRLVDQRLSTHPRVQHFVEIVAPSILRSISKSTESGLESGWGRVRGRVDWQLTVAARRETGGYAGRYVWRAPERLYDLPENRLFAFTLREVRRIARRAAGGITPSSAGLGRWRDSAARVALAAETHLGHAVLKNVRDVPNPDIRCWQRTWNHRHHEYRSLAAFLTWLQVSQGRNSLASRQLIASTYLVPLSNDSVFELFVLMKVLQAAEVEGWELSEIRAIGAIPAPVFRLSRPDANCAVFYQHTPETLKEASGYLEMFRGTGIPIAVRRPDIVIGIQGTRGEWLGLVEVKRSSSKSYISDGIYKCLGYLRDFSDIVDTQKGPKAVLVAWGGVKAVFQPNAEVSVLTANALSQGLQPFFRDALQSVS